MEQTARTTVNTWHRGSLLFKSYKVVKKLIKYGFHVTMLYFAFKGFMA
jgi:hypothetical protein